MRKTLGILYLAATMIAAAATDLTGTWTFSVDLEGGGHGDPTFVLKQANGKLTGTYTGPIGQQPVTGTVTGNKAIFGYDFERDGVKSHATYTATIDGPAKMHGTIEFKGAQGDGATGTWMGTKK